MATIGEVKSFALRMRLFGIDNNVITVRMREVENLVVLEVWRNSGIRSDFLLLEDPMSLGDSSQRSFDLICDDYPYL